MRHWFAHPLVLILLAALPVLGVTALLALRRRRRALSQLGHLPAVQALISARRRLRWLRTMGLAAGLALLCVGIAGPQWGRDWGHSVAHGRDLVVVLDMSRSMFAETPSRLDRARAALIDLSRTVQQRGGHRLALVIFAARPKLLCPLTHDYDHFRESVQQLDGNYPPRDILPAPEDATQPSSGPRRLSGTSIGAGLQEAVAAHDPRPSFRGCQDILLLSDGDDPAHDQEWREGAEAARDRGIPDGYLYHEEKLVLTRLHERPLQAIAERTGGTYTPAHTKALPLGELFRERIDNHASREDGEDDDALPAYRPRSSWFFGAAFCLLVMDMAVGRRRKASRVARSVQPGSEASP